MTRTFTGRHMAAILVAGFGIVITVNFTMATLASTTFGGVVVDNSYVASQRFNGWLEQARASQALGWSVTAQRRADGRIELRGEGVPVSAIVTGDARHPLGRVPDTQVSFETLASGRYVSREALPAGRWNLRLEIKADGQVWRGEQSVG
ncbi:FixH family protein [Novosphingobium sp. M1R2S20]|uniref:FixH family protein n=1 Tax=Novosphingobium rhizovicinum TaxID=3228928 RepID=A0ABV3RC51_9SPHN